MAAEGLEEGMKGWEEGYTLQQCQWHAVEAIKRKLIAVRRYNKDRREELVRFIWKWVESPTLALLESNREKLLAELDPRERGYITSEYQPKERAFIHVYVNTYPYLGANTTQRNEGYHPVIKACVNKTLPLAEAVHAIRNQVKDLGYQHDEIINSNRRGLPRVLDLSAFVVIARLLTYYALGILMREWEATKQWADAIELGEAEEFEVNMEDPGCPLACPLPIRYGLPCKHWLYQAVAEQVPIPLSLIHPRWLLDGPLVLTVRG